MRGKGHDIVSRLCCVRITPACAGKRPLNICWRRQKRDHPRVCGEKAAYLRAVWVPKGSPPHVRGKVASIHTLTPCRGITPACAGKRASHSETLCHTRDHPRMCGEKCLYFRATSATIRITPACAGKRLSPITPAWGRRDHPRMCGEKAFSHSSGDGSKGSPPHVRGKVCPGLQLIHVQGITPACAGKSAFPDDVIGELKDHPRMCGEKTKKIP